MKTLFTSLLFLLITVNSFSQQFFSDFNDGTLQGWTNTNATITQLTVEEMLPYTFLQKICDGTNTAVGEMAIINNDENYWAGNYFYNGLDIDFLHTIDEIVIKNDNDFDLHLRYGFKGANDYIVVTTNPIIVPALSDWEIYTQYYSIEFPIIGNLTIINDTSGLPFEEIFNNVHEMFENVVEFKIFHNEEVLYEGDVLTGTLQIESIMSYFLLGNESQDLSKFVIYPNPVNEIMTIKFPNAGDTDVVIYNILGEEIIKSSFSEITNQIDISDFSSGIYLVTIKTETSLITKKVVKL